MKPSCQRRLRAAEPRSVRLMLPSEIAANVIGLHMLGSYLKKTAFRPDLLQWQRHSFSHSFITRLKCFAAAREGKKKNYSCLWQKKIKGRVKFWPAHRTAAVNHIFQQSHINTARHAARTVGPVMLIRETPPCTAQPCDKSGGYSSNMLEIQEVNFSPRQ